MISQSVTIPADYSADTDAVFESQTPAALVVDLDGVLVTLPDGVGQPLYVNCTGANTGISFIVTGLDENGIERTDTFAGVDTNTTAGTQTFNSITSITLTGTTATAISGGWDFSTLPVVSRAIPTDTGKNPYAFTGYVVPTGTPDTYFVQYTYDDLFDMSVNPVWVNSTHTAAATLVFEETVVAPFIRLRLPAATQAVSTYTLNFYQAG